MVTGQFCLPESFIGYIYIGQPAQTSSTQAPDVLHTTLLAEDFYQQPHFHGEQADLPTSASDPVLDVPQMGSIFFHDPIHHAALIAAADYYA